jgi:hypothetical protein
MCPIWRPDLPFASAKPSLMAAGTRPWARALKPYSRTDARIFFGMLGT